MSPIQFELREAYVESDLLRDAVSVFRCSIHLFNKLLRLSSSITGRETIAPTEVRSVADTTHFCFQMFVAYSTESFVQDNGSRILMLSYRQEGGRVAGNDFALGQVNIIIKRVYAVLCSEFRITLRRDQNVPYTTYFLSELVLKIMASVCYEQYCLAVLGT